MTVDMQGLWPKSSILTVFAPTYCECPTWLLDGWESILRHQEQSKKVGKISLLLPSACNPTRPDCSLHWREAKKEGPSGCIDPGVRKMDSDQTPHQWRQEYSHTRIFSKLTAATIQTERKENVHILVPSQWYWHEDTIIARSANASVSLWE